MKQILLIILFFVACKKDNSNSQDKIIYGCEYGINKITGEKEYMQCVPHDIYMAGYNQAAANSIADNLGIAHVDVSNVENYTDWEWQENEHCDCQ